MRPAASTSVSPHPAIAARLALALALALGALACRTQPRPVAGGTISVSVRVVPPGGRLARVTASVPGAREIVLRPDGRTGEFRGALEVAPGDQRLSVEAFAGDGEALSAANERVHVPRGAPVQLDLTLRTGNGAPPPIELVDVRASSVAAGDSIPVRARLAASGPTTVRWTAKPAGCGTFADPAALSTTWTAAAPGTCTLRVEAATDERSLAVLVRTRGAPDSFPLRVSPDGRSLLDARGRPFLIKGESAWLLLANLTEVEQERYLADRAAKGFNLVEIMLLNHDYTGPPNPVPPANRRGEQPFLRPGDFSTPNDAWFDRALAFIDRAAARGIAVLIAPVYLGFDGDREGWWQELTSPQNSRPVCFAYGRYLGQRFKERKNVIWLAGGDFAPPAGSEGEARHHEVLRGIREAGASQLWTGHWNFDHGGGISTDEALFAPEMALNGIYQYAYPYAYAARASATRPARPAFLLESTYEREHGKSRLQPFRKAWWWTMLSGGGAGVIWGNNFLWMCESARGRYRATYGDADGTESSWEAELDSPGTQEVLYLHAFFEGIAWHRLVPLGIGGRPDPVTSGQTSRGGHIAVAAAPEHDLLVAYVPPDGAGPRTFALDVSGIARPARARWYDPSTGAFRPGPALAPGVTEAVLETPGRNGSGVNDWVLLIDTPERH